MCHSWILKGSLTLFPETSLEKMVNLSLDKRLVFFISRLHMMTLYQIRYSVSGNLTPKIPTSKGVKQGCVLLPLLFNFYLSDQAPFLTQVDGHSPKRGTINIPILLYADDMVLCHAPGWAFFVY